MGVVVEEDLHPPVTTCTPGIALPLATLTINRVVSLVDHTLRKFLARVTLVTCAANQDTGCNTAQNLFPKNNTGHLT